MQRSSSPLTEPTTNTTWLAMIGLMLGGALLRLPRLPLQSIAFDEGYSLAVGSAAWPTLFQATLSSGVHPPLFYIIYKTVLPLWGTSEFGGRFVVVIAGLLTIPCLYQLGRLMFGRQVGLLAAALLALNPLHVWLSQEARMYGFLILLATLSMLFFWQAVRTNQARYWLGLTVVNALLFNLHYFGLWLPFIQFVALLTDFRRYFGRFRYWVLAQFVAGLALLPWIFFTARRPAQTFGIGFLDRPDLLDLPLTYWNLAIGFSRGNFWPLTGLALLAVTAALLLGLTQPTARLWPAQKIVVLWLILPVGLVWLISQRRSFYADRYLSFVIPALLLLVSLGLTRLKAKGWRWLLIGVVLAANGYGLLLTARDPAFLKDDWRGAVAYLTAQEQPDDVILLYSTHIQFPFGYYYAGQLPQKPISLNLENYPLEPLTAGHNRAWLVYPYTRRPTHYPMQPLLPQGYWQADPDRNPLLVAWLTAHTDNIVEYQHFRGIEMWLVDLSAVQAIQKP